MKVTSDASGPGRSKLGREVALLRAIGEAQSRFVADADPRETFDKLLTSLLELTASEYGFIGEVLHTSDGAPYLKTHAITDISWDAETRRFYAENAPQGLEFTNLDTLFGAVIKTGESVVSNDPDHDPRAGGRPEGHPPLRAFLGLPLIAAGRLNGMVGIANRPGGYDGELAADLRPFLTTCASLIDSYRREKQRREEQERLRENEATVSAIVDLAADAILSINHEGAIESANRAAERMFGYSADEMFGQDISLLMPRPYRDEHASYIGNYLRTGQKKIIGIGREVTGLRKDGSTFPMELAVSEVNAVGRRMFTGIVRDVTDRNAVVAALQASNEQKQALVDAIPDLIFRIDRAGTFLSYKPARGVRLYSSPQGFLGKLISDVLPSEIAERCAQQVEQALDTGEVQQFEYTLTFEDQEQEFEARVAPAGHDEALVIVRDVTERKTAERMKSSLVSTVSHELRTPLTSIKGATETLLQEDDLSEDERIEFLQMVDGETDRLTALIDDFLDIAKIEAGKMEWRDAELDLGKVCDEALTVVGLAAQAKGITVSTDPAASLPSVFCDRDRIAQVLHNLLGNAVKFTPVDGTIHITVQARASQPPGVSVSVADNGPGIPVDDQEVIFQRFSQARGASARPGGTGLGLAISKEIIDHYAGELTVESTPGQGSTFTFFLPAGDAPPAGGKE